MKKALLIGGGGTLGTYTGKEFLKLGYAVDVICPEEKISDNENLTFYRSLATDEFLQELFAKNHYDAIVNFIHYVHPEEYFKVYPLLIQNTDHLVFLSSYRVYADEEHPIRETSPRLYDLLDPENFQDGYAAPKSVCEDFLSSQCAGQNWTVVRPVISFSHFRMDLFMYTLSDVVDAAREGRTLLLPTEAKDRTAGLDWAGNSGKLIARLAANPDTVGERYTISSGQNYTWGEVAAVYEELIGLKVRWVEEDEFLAANPNFEKQWHYIYDRKFDRKIDASKVLAATGLTKEELPTIRDGIMEELKYFGY